jgi:cell division protein FtsN
MMYKKKALVSCCWVVVLVLSGCSRQQSDWQKTRESNTAEAYEQFLKKYPTGEFTPQAQARVKELYEERDWQKARDADTPEAYQAFLKQYPEGKWMEEARIRIENFTLAQAPGSTLAAGSPAAGSPAGSAAGTPEGMAENPPAAAPPPTPRKATAPHGKKTAAAGGSSRHYGVQLGAFKSGPAAATRRWEHLEKQYPKVLAGLASKVVPTKSGSGHLYRLQAVGLTAAQARAVCKSLKAKSQACIVVKTAHG